MDYKEIMPNWPLTNTQSSKITLRARTRAGGDREVCPAEQKSPLLRAEYRGGGLRHLAQTKRPTEV